MLIDKDNPKLLLAGSRLHGGVAYLKRVRSAKFLFNVGNNTHARRLVCFDTDCHLRTVGFTELIALRSYEFEYVLSGFVAVVKLNTRCRTELRPEGCRCGLADLYVANELLLLKLLNFTGLREAKANQQFLFPHGRGDHEEEEDHKYNVRRWR